MDAPVAQKEGEAPPAQAIQLNEERISLIDQLQVGSSRREVIQALGEPGGKVNLGDTEILYYPGVELKIKNSSLVELPANLSEALAAGLEAAKQEAKQQAKVAEKPRATVQASANQNIRQGGKAIDISTLVGKGTVTIVDFYADWCGPCRQAEPHLKKMAEDPNVNLIQIDIVNWSTPVVQQYGLRSIPNMRVFDAKGRQIGSPTHSVSEVQKNVKKALRS